MAALCAIALGDGGPGLAADAGALALQASRPRQWRVSQPAGKHPWLKLCAVAEGAEELCLDLSNPGQQPQLAPDADVSGQYWQATSQAGCKELPGGAVARCVLGYKLHAMWTGEERLLTAVGDGVELKPEGEAGQVWEILLEDGSLWMPSSPGLDPELQVEEPQLISCDFGHPDIQVQEPELISCDFGHPDIQVEEPEMVSCDFGRPEAEVFAPEIAVEAVPQMLCGGLAPESAGGPTELLETLKGDVEAKAQETGWNGMFTHWEPVSSRTQVVAGTNHYCKVRVREDAYAHVVIYEPLPGQGPARVTKVELPKGRDDPL